MIGGQRAYGRGKHGTFRVRLDSARFRLSLPLAGRGLFRFRLALFLRTLNRLLFRLGSLLFQLGPLLFRLDLPLFRLESLLSWTSCEL